MLVQIFSFGANFTLKIIVRHLEHVSILGFEHPIHGCYFAYFKGFKIHYDNILKLTAQPAQIVDCARFIATKLDPCQGQDGRLVVNDEVDGIVADAVFFE